MPVGDSSCPKQKLLGDCAFVGLYGEKASQNGSASVDSFFGGWNKQREVLCFLYKWESISCDFIAFDAVSQITEV